MRKGAQAWNAGSCKREAQWLKGWGCCLRTQEVALLEIGYSRLERLENEAPLVRVRSCCHSSAVDWQARKEDCKEERQLFVWAVVLYHFWSGCVPFLVAQGLVESVC